MRTLRHREGSNIPWVGGGRWRRGEGRDNSRGGEDAEGENWEKCLI